MIDEMVAGSRLLRANYDKDGLRSLRRLEDEESSQYYLLTAWYVKLRAWGFLYV